MKNKQLKGSLIILAASLIWGSTFIAQRKATELIDAFTFTFCRSIIAVFFLFIISLITKNKIEVRQPKSKVKLYIYACLAGITVFLGFIFQQLGLDSITASKSGFISSLYIIMVPLLTLTMGRRVRPQILICAVIALFGSYFLSTTGSFEFSKGELLTVLSAFFFSLQIIFVDLVSPYMNPFKFCMIQFLFVLVLSGTVLLVRQNINFSNILKALPFIFYAGFLSSTIGFSCQIIGQKYAEPTIASLFMAMESVFALLCGVIFLHETMKNREILGSILTFSSVIISQLPFERWFTKHKKEL